MAYWGIAMTHYHQLWEPALSPAAASAEQESSGAAEPGNSLQCRRAFINALAFIFQDASSVPYRTRAPELRARHERSRSTQNKNDVEAQVFYALALLANLSPTDKTHKNQKQAVDLLEPLYRTYPQHPGIPHYPHPCLRQRRTRNQRPTRSKGLCKDRALWLRTHCNMLPIFTRLGLWDDSIASNIAARNAAHQQGDTGEELHAMDYLEYAYLQSGRDQDAARVVQQLKEMSALNAKD